MKSKAFWTLIFLSVIGPLSAQTAKFGKFNENEIAYAEVPYEPDASAVVLLDQGSSQFNGSVFETTYFVRIKILKETGKSYGDVRLRFYSGQRRTEEISGVRAEITSFVGGKANTEKVPNSAMFELETEGGYREYRITFPNVQVGSILEYSYKKTDKNIEFLDAWTFQNEIPTLYSHYQITMIPQLRYRTLGQGENFIKKAEKTESYGTYGYTLRNLYGFKEEPYMKNYRDYFDRVEFQLSQYAQGSEWVDLITSWEKLGDELIEIYRDKGYYRSGLIEREFLDLDLSADTQREIAKKAYYYLRDNFSIIGDDWIYPAQTLPQLLKAKSGSPTEMILAFMGLLKSAGITCEPIMIGSKGYGRTDIVPYPFLSQFDEILLLAELDGKKEFLDLNDRLAPFGYVDMDKHVKAGLYLQKEKSQLIPLEFKHNSNSVIVTDVTYLPDSGLITKNQIREYHYNGLKAAHVVESFEKSKTPLEKIFESEAETMKVLNVNAKDKLMENNFYSVSFDTQLEELKNEDLLIINPIKFSSYDENPFTAAYRVFPVDFEYATTETSTVNIMIPEGYELDDYPLAESLTIPGGYLAFTYQITVMKDRVVINSKFEIRKPFIPQQQYGALKYFMESVASKLHAPLVLKKIATP
ncbi:DUF3857 domain-containing protein [Algoriphagus namhaensis]